MVGHLTDSIQNRYAISDEASLKESAAKLSRLHQSEKDLYRERHCRQQRWYGDATQRSKSAEEGSGPARTTFARGLYLGYGISIVSKSKIF